VKRRHGKTLADIFATPTRGSISWRDMEKLLVHLGAEISEGRGSRIRVVLNGAFAVFHRPHPQKEACKGAVEAIRRFLNTAGVKP
jgi:hypothetical protein